MKKLNWNIERIQNYIEENNLSKTKFAKECGVSVETINKIFKNNTKLQLKSFVKIVNKMKIKSDDLLFRN